MNDDEFKMLLSKAVQEAFINMKLKCPVDTGLLRSTIKLLKVSEKEYQIRIGSFEAYYNEKLNDNQFTDFGNINTHRYWYDRVVEETISILKKNLMGGK